VKAHAVALVARSSLVGVLPVYCMLYGAPAYGVRCQFIRGVRFFLARGYSLPVQFTLVR